VHWKVLWGIKIVLKWRCCEKLEDEYFFSYRVVQYAMMHFQVWQHSCRDWRWKVALLLSGAVNILLCVYMVHHPCFYVYCSVNSHNEGVWTNLLNLQNRDVCFITLMSTAQPTPTNTHIHQSIIFSFYTQLDQVYGLIRVTCRKDLWIILSLGLY